MIIIVSPCQLKGMYEVGLQRCGTRDPKVCTLLAGRLKIRSLLREKQKYKFCLLQVRMLVKML
jgi:hypothetical protein